MDKPLMEIMTVDEVAEYLRIPLSSVYKLSQEGKIPGQKVGRHWRFHRETIVSWMMGKNNVILQEVPAVHEE